MNYQYSIFQLKIQKDTAKSNQRVKTLILNTVLRTLDRLISLPLKCCSFLPNNVGFPTPKTSFIPEQHLIGEGVGTRWFPIQNTFEVAVLKLFINTHFHQLPQDNYFGCSVRSSFSQVIITMHDIKSSCVK